MTSHFSARADCWLRLVVVAFNHSRQQKLLAHELFRQSEEKIREITSARFSVSMKQVLALLWQHAAVRSLEIARCQRR